MHSQIVVNPRFHGGTKIGKGGPVLAAKIGLGGPVLTGDRFFRYRPNGIKSKNQPKCKTAPLKHASSIIYSILLLYTKFQSCRLHP